jgi:hypothetical protein
MRWDELAAGVGVDLADLLDAARGARRLAERRGQPAMIRLDLAAPPGMRRRLEVQARPSRRGAVRLTLQVDGLPIDQVQALENGLRAYLANDQDDGRESFALWRARAEASLPVIQAAQTLHAAATTPHVEPLRQQVGAVPLLLLKRLGAALAAYNRAARQERSEFD